MTNTDVHWSWPVTVITLFIGLVVSLTMWWSHTGFHPKTPKVVDNTMTVAVDTMYVNKLKETPEIIFGNVLDLPSGEKNIFTASMDTDQDLKIHVRGKHIFTIHDWQVPCQ